MVLATLSDDALIARVAGGDADAFTQLYRRYERPVFSVLLRLGGQRALAEEWLQEAFTRVWLAAHTHDPARGAVKPWIYAIALNTARSELARKRHRTPHLSLDETEMDLPDAAGGEPGLAERLDDRRHASALTAALAELPDYLREVVVLRCSRELSFAEIAEATGAPQGTLKSRFHRIGRLPVDATLVSEIESRFFEQQASGPFYVWAMDTRGDFAFGVPRSAFAKLNAVYDREVTPRLKEGVFLDRQTFLMSLVDDSDEIGPELVTEGKPAVEGRAVELVERGRRFQLNRWEPENAFVLSVPLRAEDGSALGSLYLKQAPVRERDYYHRDERIEGVLSVAGGLVGLSIAFLWVLLPTWVYVDARERGVRRAQLFAFLTVLSSLVGLVVYLIARPEDLRRLTCPGCAREVNGGAFCPHCGRDLSAAICTACRYPLKPDWAFCPACRTEIRPQAAGTPVTEAG